MTTIVPHIPENAPFSSEQRAWLNGFMAGLFSRERMQAAAAQDASASLSPLTILFGSQTGNAEALAKQLAKKAGKRGFAPTVYDMAEYPIENLKHDTKLMIITSTYGDGDPPDNAQEFWSRLSGDSPPLPHLDYSILALGDSNYEQFCQFGKELDARLETLGAKRAFQRIDSDVDYDEAFELWINGALTALHAAAPQAALPGSTNGKIEKETPEGYSKNNPFTATVSRVEKLNAEGAEKDTRHVEISLKGSGLDYKVGDALGVWPHNSPNEVDALINALGLDPKALAEIPKEGSIPLREALQFKMDISKASKNFLKWLHEKTASDLIEELLEPGNKEKLDSYLWGREILDVLNEIPTLDIAPQELIDNLKPLQPRLYSISSSPNAHPDEVHITVGVIRYDSHGREHHGVCSGFLARLAEEGSTVPVFISPSKNFGLPDNPQTPILMVGPGTGIAPFRAFLEERKHQGGQGKSWLFFGNPHESQDYLYRDQMESLEREGALTHLTTAFSRDQDEKIYVQHRMVEQAREIYQWLEEGACFYVCGDAKRMAKDVHQALHTIVQKAGGFNEEQAAEYIQRLQAEKRYQRDVY